MSIPEFPTFDLVDHDGRAVTEADYRGMYALIFFGFTHCEMVCPRALARLTKVLQLLDSAAERIQPLYITVDPARDTPEKMRHYLAKTAPNFTGLSGTPAQIELARRAFHVYVRHTVDPSVPGGYRTPHTAFTYLLGPDGRFITHFGDAISAEAVASQIKTIMDDRDMVRPDSHAADHQQA